MIINSYETFLIKNRILNIKSKEQNKEIFDIFSNNYNLLL